MAAISAQTVNEFRKLTGLGLMDCKKLLTEADGDLKKAETLAKERGLKKAADRAGRTASAGRVEVQISEDGRSGSFIELNCETDFVARNDDFQQGASELALHVLNLQDLQGAKLDVEAIKAQPFFKDPSKTIADKLLELNSRTGENVQFSRAARFSIDGPGRVDSYIHHNKSEGALAAVTCPSDEVAQSDAVLSLVKDLALHAVASKPIANSREEVPAEAVEEQLRIFKTQVADKPENMQEKIAQGKLNSWYGEIVLVDQVFVKDSSKKVSAVIKSAGDGIELFNLVRFAVGE